MKCDRCFQGTDKPVKVPHTRFRDVFLIFCPKCAKETGNARFIKE